MPFLRETMPLDYGWTSAYFMQAVSWGHNFSVKETGRYMGGLISMFICFPKYLIA